MSTPTPDEIAYPEVSVGEIMDAMDELGRAKFDAALNSVRARKAMTLLQLERQKQTTTPATDDAPPGT